MPCNPADNNLNPPAIPGIPIPGFGIPFSPVQLPVPGFKLPDGFPESILDLINNLNINWPGGPIGPQIDNFGVTVLKAIMDLFGQIMPFMSLYNFFMALLNMVSCIIDVLCALSNPFKLIRAIRRLIKTCLPPFLNLFPWAALITMIISLLLLLLALILYILERVLEIIRDLLLNLDLLTRGLTLQDAEATVAVSFKIASLLCIIENLVAMFGAIAAIFAIIETLSQIAGAGVCSRSSSSGCCGDDVCPPFIRDNPDGIKGSLGRLIYYNQIVDPNQTPNPFFSTILGANNTSNTLRKEIWQFVNDDPDQVYMFKDIITRYKDNTATRNNNGSSRSNSDAFEYGDIFWPEGVSYTNETTLRKAPYSVDLTLKDIDLNQFDSTYKTVEPTTVVIKNAIVDVKPYIGERRESGSIEKTDDTNNLGTLSIVGGFAYYHDGSTPILNSQGDQLSLEDIIHLKQTQSPIIPSYDDGYEISDIEFTLNINHASLLGYNLTVAGCVPDIAIEAEKLNARFAETFIPIIAKVGNMPDVAGAQKCVSSALEKLRKDVTTDNVLEAQASIVLCLEDLKNQTEDAFCRALFAGVDPYESTFEIDPDMQFVSREIKVYVELRDSSGINISKNIPDSCIPNILENLKGEVTLGEISDFTYDIVNSRFIGNITTDIGGEGELRISWRSNIFQNIINSDDVDVDTVFEDNMLPYTFVGLNRANQDNRRDAGDVANNSENS
jgi:hypothetical protein